MVKRRTPIRHRIKGYHRKDGTWVKPSVRGSGVSYIYEPNKRVVVGKNGEEVHAGMPEHVVEYFGQDIVDLSWEEVLTKIFVANYENDPMKRGRLRVIFARMGTNPDVRNMLYDEQWAFEMVDRMVKQSVVKEHKATGDLRLTDKGKQQMSALREQRKGKRR